MPASDHASDGRPPAFHEVAFWDAAALQPETNATEWVTSYDQLAPLLERFCFEASCPTVLHVGCGVSSLSQSLRDAGCRHQLAFDFSMECMMRQRTLCPDAGNAQMDCTNLGLRTGSVDVVIDKSTIDAMICADDGEENCTTMAHEVRRVLRPDGIWLVLSLNPPETMLPILQQASATAPDETHLVIGVVACYSLPKRMFAYMCKLLSLPLDSSPVVMQRAQRGWLRAVHACPGGGLLTMSSHACVELGAADGGDDADVSAELTELVLLHQLLPTIRSTAIPRNGDTNGEAEAGRTTCPSSKTVPQLPPSLCSRVHRETLVLLQLPERLGVTALPDELCQLRRLHTLDCRRNKLCALSEDIARCLSALETLLLDHNRLAMLPKNLGALSRLETLSVTSNLLKELPPSWRLLDALRTLRLQGNPLSLLQVRELRGCAAVRLDETQISACEN
uniref:Methyltransferase type 11 domain-containing protein n=2 Tax=Prymnesium polylepis TaxID=72548 RepID=A0A6V4E7U2_9EUKA|mmetsp:Transcript_63073/g.173264  ORF Transcript_63073/g.173264 Transcript_63073/m.173264 type:complete len:450 (-) Transcript_63073:263-1612(-)